MMQKLFWGILLSLLAFAGGAFADQAALIEKGKAYQAAALVSPGMELRRFCAPCGDAAWTSLTVRGVEVRPASGSYYELAVNGKGVDLAYVYIRTDGRWRNLAMTVGVPVSDIPEFLDDDRGAAGEENSHPITVRLNRCMDRDTSTAGMVNCLGVAYDSWDRELNRVYGELMARLNPKEKKALKTAQLAWLRYRDREFESIGSIYAGFDGTMYRPMHIDSRVAIVRQRVLILLSYLSLFESP
ncbi:hypothetical protein DENIS_2753 [Desulfonema ishimotonii]|uniref:Lysozyme inhibitor LprI-like N-terminal domain-containing protein n=1 Tax=Desulfonema ishimotonii TaxID=45657 RepID=A0A401FXU6_9BACT|nr:lysozyme inhibitor LprI family protein [Desulfonema ishimotonii]GBC61791.1 hypothetical protein DENIS_2753 [Desulfonema ishimotonii]